MVPSIILMSPLLQPSYGLVIWTLLAFLTVLFLLKKFAWKPILKALNEREDSIQAALDTAKKTQEEMALIRSGHEKLLADARLERDNILKEARDAKDVIIGDAKNKAQVEANQIVTRAMEEISNQKIAAITEIQNQVAKLSVEIAEKIIRYELTDDAKQKALIAGYLKEVNLN